MSDEPLLSGEETDALLDAMKASEDREAPPINAINLTEPDRGLREALAYADQAADKFSHHAEKVFLRHLGVASHFETEPSEISPYEVVQKSAPNGAALAVLEGRSGSQALFVVGPGLVSVVLERALGAPLVETPEEEGVDPDEHLSSVDRRLLRPFLSGAIEAFSKAWCRKDATMSCVRIVGRPDELPEIGRSEPVLRISWRVAPGVMAADRLHVVIPSAFLADTGPEAKPPPPRASLTDRKKILGRLRSAKVELAAVLGQTRTSVRNVLSLDRGHVIRLATGSGEPVILTVADRVVGTGQPVIRQGNLAVEVVALQDPTGDHARARFQRKGEQ